MPTSPTRTYYRAAAWTDPGSGHINLSLARTVVDGDDSETETVEDWDCSTRRPIYGEIPADESFGPEPTRPAVALSPREAEAIREALDRAIRAHDDEGGTR